MSITFFDFLPYLVVIALISMVDFITLVRAKYSRKHHAELHDLVEPHLDYSILIPIFGNLSYLKNVEFLKQYSSKVILCTTTKENTEFNREINKIAKKFKFKIFRSEVPLASAKHKPNPWALFRNTLHHSSEIDSVDIKINKEIARDEIIRDSFIMVDTEFCIFLDGDTTAKESFDHLIGLMIEKNYDIASVRVLASKKETMIEKLQSIEYELAMDARKIYPWLTSGASMVAKTAVIKDVMKHHSLFFSGGDIEIGKLSKMLGYRVGHLYFEFFTDVPTTFKAWWNQRLAWCGGGFRHAIINMHKFSWRHPMFYFYTTFLVYILTPLRWYEVIKRPLVIPLVIAMYWVLILVFHWKYAKPYYFLFPFYALIQILFIVPLGFYTYLKMALHAENVGLIKLRHDK